MNFAHVVFCLDLVYVLDTHSFFLFFIVSEMEQSLVEQKARSSLNSLLSKKTETHWIRALYIHTYKVNFETPGHSVAEPENAGLPCVSRTSKRHLLLTR